MSPFNLTHPVYFPCGRKPEYPEKTFLLYTSLIASYCILFISPYRCKHIANSLLLCVVLCISTAPVSEEPLSLVSGVGSAFSVVRI